MVVRLRDSVGIGVDVAGRPEKGYDLSALEWRAGAITSVRFASCPHPVELPETGAMRKLVAQGDYTALARLTHLPAQRIAENLWRAIATLSADPLGVFIDSPSAFSRNSLGHGRLTEKQRFEKVTFQSTPSTCCGREHGGTWSWLVYGIVAFTAVIHEGGSFTLAEWEALLADGAFPLTKKLPRALREVFPTASVSHWRTKGRSAEMAALVKPLVRRNPDEIRAVLAYLENGVWGTKRAGDRVYDRADAFVAGLSSLPFVAEGFMEELVWPANAAKWAGAKGAEVVEGAVALVV